MSFDKLGNGALNYAPCKYGNSRLQFRGPRRRLKGDYIAFLGGTETYGKFIKSPFPALVEREIGVRCVNFGWVNAGVDVFCNDPTVLEAAGRARMTVIQVMGAQNMSNRFYMVHPRRNDRFVSASSLMKTIFPEIDFTEFHFTRHMLGRLNIAAPDRFNVMRSELKSAWVARMRLLLSMIKGPKVLFWMADHAPALEVEGSNLGPDPMFVDRYMIEEIRPLVDDLIEVTVSEAALKQGTEGMICSEMELLAARKMLGPAAHAEAMAALSAPLQLLLG